MAIKNPLHAPMGKKMSEKENAKRKKRKEDLFAFKTPSICQAFHTFSGAKIFWGVGGREEMNADIEMREEY